MNITEFLLDIFSVAIFFALIAIYVVYRTKKIEQNLANSESAEENDPKENK